MEVEAVDEGILGRILVQEGAEGVGASAVLVGESLLREDDPGQAARRLLGFV